MTKGQIQVAELAGNSPQTIYKYYTISDKEKGQDE